MTASSLVSPASPTYPLALSTFGFGSAVTLSPSYMSDVYSDGVSFRTPSTTLELLPLTTSTSIPTAIGSSSLALDASLVSSRGSRNGSLALRNAGAEPPLMDVPTLKENLRRVIASIETTEKGFREPSNDCYPTLNSYGYAYRNSIKPICVARIHGECLPRKLESLRDTLCFAGQYLGDSHHYNGDCDHTQLQEYISMGKRAAQDILWELEADCPNGQSSMDDAESPSSTIVVTGDPVVNDPPTSTIWETNYVPAPSPPTTIALSSRTTVTETPPFTATEVWGSGAGLEPGPALAGIPLAVGAAVALL